MYYKYIYKYTFLYITIISFSSKFSDPWILEAWKAHVKNTLDFTRAETEVQRREWITQGYQ